MKNKIDLIVYGDFKKSSLEYKAFGASSYIEFANNLGILNKVICRGGGLNKNFVKAIPFGSFFPKVLTFVQEKTGLFLRNFSQNILFDYFAAKKIESKFVLSFAQGLKRCQKITKEKGGVYVEVSTIENPEIYLEKLERENAKFNFKTNKEVREVLKNSILTAKNSDYIVAISDHAKDTYIEKGYDENKLIVIDQIIDINNFKPKKQYLIKKKLKIVTVAHFQILKGLHYLVRAVLDLNDEEVELCVVGDINQDSLEALKIYASGFINCKNIKFMGKVKNVLEYYNNFDIFILPSISEGYGRAIAEAMACGLPVIITDSCGVEINDGVEGFVVESGSVEQLKKKILFFKKEKRAIENMGKKARMRIEKICDLNSRKNNIKGLCENILNFK